MVATMCRSLYQSSRWSKQSQMAWKRFLCSSSMRLYYRRCRGWISCTITSHPCRDGVDELSYYLDFPLPWPSPAVAGALWVAKCAQRKNLATRPARRPYAKKAYREQDKLTIGPQRNVTVVNAKTLGHSLYNVWPMIFSWWPANRAVDAITVCIIQADPGKPGWCDSG